VSRDAVAAWRELVAIAGDRYSFDLAMGARPHALCGHWRDELVKLEHDLKDLEAQCCPPDAATEQELKNNTWRPTTESTPPWPRIDGARIATAKPGAPLRITAKISSPSPIVSAKLRYRHVTQYEDYLSLDFTPTGAPGEFAATVPGEFLTPQWDFMYFIEVIDQAGRGRMWPDFSTESPYVIVKLER
jgi:hypothetical protein